MLHETFLILRKINWDAIINVHVQYPSFFRILMKLGLLRQIFGKKTSNIEFHDNPPVAAKLFHADRLNETISSFRNFWDASQN